LALNNDLEENKTALLVKFENEMRSDRILIGMKTNQFLKMTHLNVYFSVAKTGPPNVIIHSNSMTTTMKRNEYFKIGSRSEQYSWIKMEKNIGTSNRCSHTTVSNFGAYASKNNLENRKRSGKS